MLDVPQAEAEFPVEQDLLQTGEFRKVCPKVGVNRPDQNFGVQIK